MLEDEKIIDLFWNRSENAVSQTKEKYGGYLLTISYNILHDKQDSEECENDTYLHTWNSIPNLHPQNLKAYLAKTIRNISISRFRYNHAKKRSGTVIISPYDELAECIPASTNSDSASNEVLNQILNNFLAALSEEQRIIFMKRYWYFFSIEEISEQMKKSSKSITNTLYWVRKKLKKTLAEEYYHGRI